MIQLMTCNRCNGFLALALNACPHCNAPTDRARRAILGLAALAGGSAVSMTLMACYGSACVEESDVRCGYVPDDSGAHVPSDARADGDANPGDASSDGGGDASDGGASDAAADGDAADASDAIVDAATDG